MTIEHKLEQVDARTRPVGRILRFALGAFLVAMLIRSVIDASSDLMAWTAFVVFALIAFYTLTHLLVMRFLPNINPYLGTVLALGPAIAVFILTGAAGQMGVTGYIGGSLLLDAITADLGCEVMALPGLIFRQRTHLCCLLFSPIDWLENRFLNL